MSSDDQHTTVATTTAAADDDAESHVSENSEPMLVEPCPIHCTTQSQVSAEAEIPSSVLHRTDENFNSSPNHTSVSRDVVSSLRRPALVDCAAAAAAAEVADTVARDQEDTDADVVHSGVEDEDEDDDVQSEQLVSADEDEDEADVVQSEQLLSADEDEDEADVVQSEQLVSADEDEDEADDVQSEQDDELVSADDAVPVSSSSEHHSVNDVHGTCSDLVVANGGGQHNDGSASDTDTAADDTVFVSDDDIVSADAVAARPISRLQYKSEAVSTAGSDTGNSGVDSAAGTMHTNTEMFGKVDDDDNNEPPSDVGDVSPTSARLLPSDIVEPETSSCHQQYAEAVPANESTQSVRTVSSIRLSLSVQLTSVIGATEAVSRPSMELVDNQNEDSDREMMAVGDSESDVPSGSEVLSQPGAAATSRVVAVERLQQDGKTDEKQRRTDGLEEASSACSDGDAPHPSQSQTGTCCLFHLHMLIVICISHPVWDAFMCLFCSAV